MSKWIVGTILGLAICFISSASVCAETYTLDPETVVGIGADKATARDEAKGLRDDLVEIYDDLLDGTNGSVVGVNSTYTWDGVAYEITFEIIVTFNDD